jgi:NADPH:quinone reductase-like Zn-dependent oxidoreductase
MDMKAWILGEAADAPIKLVRDAVRPVPRAGEVVIRVQAVGVTPGELAWYPTTHNRDGSRRSDVIPIHEFAGMVMEVGEGVRDFVLGEDVFGMNDWFSQGALAEYCVARPEQLARKPRSLSFAEAAAVPISALTAWQGLVERARVREGETVLIHGGAGGVGSFAVQLAKLGRAHVITTASERNRSFLMQLGADDVIDYHAQNFAKLVSKVDVVFDTVGGETLARSWDLLAPGGRMVSVSSNSENVDDERTKKAFFIVEPNGDQLTKIAELLDQGRLHVVVDAILPCTQADRAYTGNVVPRLGRGKVVILAEEVHWDLEEG